MTTNNFQVHTETFDGPFDLLLTLIEKRKMHVGDIALQQVADDYITYVNNRNDFPMEETASFILTASTILLIKSRALLPILDLTEEEEEDVEQLQERLRIYKQFKDIASSLSSIWQAHMLFARHYVPAPEPTFTPSDDLTVTVLQKSLQELLSASQKDMKPLPKARVEKLISLEEMMDHLHTRIERSLSLSFNEFSQMGKVEKVDVIISFLAMLELVKQGALDAAQQGAFSDITLQSTKPSNTPRYN